MNFTFNNNTPQNVNFLGNVVKQITYNGVTVWESEESSGLTNFNFNYNFKDYDSSTKTVPNADNANFDQDLVLQGTPVVSDGMVTVTSSDTYAVLSTQLFNRSSSDPALTFIVKIGGSCSGSFCANRGSANGNTYNWMARSYKFHDSKGEKASISLSSYPNTLVYRVNTDGSLEVKSLTDSKSNTSSVTYSYTATQVTFFCESYGTDFEKFTGKVYWMYQANRYLSDAEVQKVVDYNENYEPEPSEDDLILTFSDGTTSSITYDDHIIPYNAFYENTDIVAVTIGDNVTTIGESAFDTCENLSSVTIGKGVTTIEDWAFSCTNLTSFIIPDNVTSLGSGAFLGCSSLSSVTIGNGVTSIDNYAFANCSGLTNIDIPDSVTSIGNQAFQFCTSLTNIEIPDSVTSIGEFAISFCDSLTNVNIPDSVTTIGCAAFSTCEKLTTITIGNGVTSIEEATFQNCSSLTNIEIPDSVTSIGESAFNNCTSLSSINIPDSVTTIGNQAFQFCTSLTNIEIPDSVTTIGQYAFKNCTNLSSVTIGSGLTSLSANAFLDCSSLTSITSNASTAPTIQSTTFNGVATNGTLTVPSGCTSNYSTWMSTDANYLGYYNWTCKEPSEDDLVLTFSDGTTSSITYSDHVIPVSGFSGNTSIVAAKIGDEVTSIGGYAFMNCTNLSSVTIGNGVTTIGTNSFDGSSITSVTIPDSVTTITPTAFQDCTKLSSVTIGNGVTSVGACAFYKCSSLTSLTIGSAVTTIGYSAFESTKLTDITIPNSVKTIGTSAFTQCTNLSDVTIGSGCTSISANAFLGCSSLTSITSNATTAPSIASTTFSGVASNGVLTVPVDCVSNYSTWYAALPSGWKPEYDVELTLDDGSTTFYTYSDHIIPANAFKNRTDIVGVLFGDSVTSIGDYAFYGCSNIVLGVEEWNDIEFPDSLTSIGKYAFAECNQIEEFDFGYESSSNLTSIGEGAFSGCSSVNIIGWFVANTPSIGNNAFNGISEEGTVYYGGEGTSTVTTLQTRSEFSSWTFEEVYY